MSEQEKHWWQRRRFTVWISGIWAAVVHGSAAAGSAFIGLAMARGVGADVPQLNLSQLGAVLAASGLSSLFAFLRESPIPREEDDTDHFEITQAQKEAASKLLDKP